MQAGISPCLEHAIVVTDCRDSGIRRRHLKLWFGTATLHSHWHFIDQSKSCGSPCKEGEQIIESNHTIHHRWLSVDTREDSHHGGPALCWYPRSRAWKLNLALPARPGIGHLTNSPGSTQALLKLTVTEHRSHSMDSSQFIPSTLMGNHSVSRLFFKFWYQI